jgi:hypothetical protein
MIEWVMRNKGLARPVANAARAADPFPTDKQPPAGQSTAGKIMRNVGEAVPGAVAGVESAIENSIGFAIDPLANWLNEHVADLSYTREAPQTPTGQISKSVSEFLTGFIPALKGLKLAGMASKVAGPMLASGIADFAVHDPHEARLSNLWQTMGLPKNVLTDYLAAKPEDGAMEGRFKSATESVLTGAALEGVTLGARAIRAVKAVKGGQEAEMAALKERYGELSNDSFKKAIGDPSKPMLETVVKQPSAAAGKVKKGLQEAAGTTPDDLVGGRGVIDAGEMNV